MVSIIIVNYHVKKEIFSCIQSILNLKESTKFEIIVVDNSEKDELSVDLKKKFKSVKYIKPEKNLGYGAGNNLGVKNAICEYIFILNPDTKISSGNIKSLTDFISKNKKIGAVAPQLLDFNNNVYDEQGASELTPGKAFFVLSFLNKLFKKNRFWKIYWGIPWNRSKPKEVDVVPGTAFVIRRDLFEKIGGFDEKFFLYFEEFDFCKRLREKGYKNYILPGLKIEHEWGASTKQNTSSNKYFLKSRLYYFRKNYGLFKAILLESFLRINKNFIIISLIILIGLILRAYNLENKITFNGDAAWFFVSAREMITQKIIPYVGITSSHVWLHQGAFWTYMLAFVLPLVKYNPINVAYFTILLDLATLILVYLFCKKYFSEKVALFASLFYATSPLLIFSSQNPYHTTPIPFLTILLLFSVMKWIKGNINFFPIIILLLSFLYNFQISVLPLIFSVFVLLLFGIYRKTSWTEKLINIKIILSSLLAFFIPMIPMLLHDLSHGFSQTLKVGIWIAYRIVVLLGYPPINPDFKGDSWNSIINFFLDYNSRYFFSRNIWISLGIFSISLIFLIYAAKKNKFKNVSENILILFLIIPITAYFVSKTNSAAYLPMFFVQLAVLIGYFFANIKKKYFFVSTSIFAMLILINSFGVLSSYEKNAIKSRINASEKIIKITSGKPYNIVMVGPVSKFDSSRLNFDYITWWLGYPPSGNEEKTIIYINEQNDRIIINKGK